MSQRPGEGSDARWELRVIGESLLLAADGTESTLSSKSKRFAVLLFLAIPTEGRRVRRDELLATFWPELDAARARNALRSTLHQLRQTLGPDVIGGSGEEEVSLNPAAVDVDFLVLSDALNSGSALPWLARPSLELVPGLHVADAAPFQEWLEAQRQTLSARIVQSACKIADAAEATLEFPDALVAARVAARLAREDESVLRRLISLLDRSGDRAGALAAFESFEAWLRHEFEVSPAPETLTLVQQIRDRTWSADVIHAPRPQASQPPGTSAPQARRRERSVPVVATLCAVVVIGAAAVWQQSDRARMADQRTPIAILPFRSEIADSALAYCAPALGESIADGLPSAAIISYDASLALDTGERDAVRGKLRDLGARVVVSGVVGGGRDSLELRLTISSVGDPTPLRQVNIRGSERRLVVLRDTALSLIRSFARIPDTRVAGRHIPIPEAYQLSLNASWLLGRRTREELLKSRDLYSRALEIDPEWPDLWIGMARATGALSYRHFIDYRPGLRASEHAANEAMKRSPNDARALIERSLARFQLGDAVGAEADARRAAALDSTDWYMQSLIGTWWQWSGGPLDSALFYTRRAQRLAPWDRQVALNILEIVGCMPDSALVLREARRVLDMDPNQVQALEVLSWTLTRFSRWDEATRVYERRYKTFVDAGVTAPLTKLDGEARFRATVRALRQAEYDDQRVHPPPAVPLLENRIALFEDLGLRDSSIALLSSVVDSLDVHHANMMCAPNLTGFRRDPRTQAIVRRRGWIPAEFARVP